MNEPELMHHEHLSDEALIELALETPSARPRATRPTPLPRELAHCASCTARLENWRAFLASLRARSSDTAPDPAAVSALAERVLASTTRDPARAARRRSAAWMRAAVAASLLAVLSLALAWKSELWRGGPTEERAGALVPHEAVPEVAAGETAGVAAAVDQERTRLVRFDVPERIDAARTAVGRMLQARGEWLGKRAPIALGDESPAATLSRALAWDGAVRALCCEHLLDRYLIEEHVPEGLDHALAVLLDARTQSGSERRLELAALSRAREYGLLDGEQCAKLDRAFARAGVDAQGEPLFSGTPRSGAPIDVAWLGALEAALDGSERGDPVVSAWLASAR